MRNRPTVSFWLILSLVCSFTAMSAVRALSADNSDKKEEFKRAVLKEALVKDPAQDGAKVSVNFKNAPLTDVVLSLSRQAGRSIVIDKSIDVSKAKVTCFYYGASFEEALDSVVAGLDLAYRVSDGTYFITEFEEAILNVNDIYVKHKEDTNTTSSGTSNTSLNSGGSFAAGGMGGSGTGGNSPSSSGSNNQTSSEHSDREIDKMLISIKPILSGKGVITKMSSGFIYVRDIPSRIKMVRKMIRLDDARRTTIMMKISLLRIDYKDEYESGINWWALLKKSSGPTVEVSSNFMGSRIGGATGNVAALTITDTDLTAVIKALENYGTVNVVQTWETRAVSGATLPFFMYQTIWYSTGSIVQVVNNQTITTPQMESTEVGLKLTMNPMKMEKGKSYLVNTSIDLSNLLGYQRVGELEMPNIERNYVSIPIRMSVGETVAISGFKIKKTDKQRLGIPFLVRIPVLSYLFGYSSALDNTSELTVVITFSEETGA